MFLPLKSNILHMHTGTTLVPVLLFFIGEKVEHISLLRPLLSRRDRERRLAMIHAKRYCSYAHRAGLCDVVVRLASLAAVHMRKLQCLYGTDNVCTLHTHQPGAGSYLNSRECMVPTPCGLMLWNLR